MKRSLALAVVTSVVAASLAAASSCTIFDGLTVPSEGGADAVAEAGDAGDGGGAEGGSGYLSLADGVRFCSNAFKCPFLAPSSLQSLGVPVDIAHFSGCVSWVAGPIPPDRPGIDVQRRALECAARANGCTAAGTCMWWENIDPKDPRCTGYDGGANGSCADDAGTVQYCTGGILAHCDNEGYAPGSFCQKGKDGEWRCALQMCAQNQSESCMGAYEMYCGATSNLWQGLNCAATGYTCGLDPQSGFINCLTGGQLKACSATSVTCGASGTNVSVCDGVQVGEFNCLALGGTCDGIAALPRCKLPNEQCSPYDVNVDQCTGSTLAMCVGGRKQSFDCASIGLVCKPAAGMVGAHCE